MKTTPQVLKGMRDFLPARMILRHWVIEQVRRVFERFGFEPLETPAIEYLEVLEGKNGAEADKLIYSFEDRGGRRVGLRYDLTVPLARVVAMYPELPKPFKRYQIGPVWRAERPQRGRYREFYQCDADIVGSASMLADAEVVTVAYQALRQLGFTRFQILINNRKLIQAVGTRLAVPAERVPLLWRAIDKWEKIGPAGVRAELLESGFDPSTIDRLLGILDVPADTADTLSILSDRLGDIPLGAEGIRELEELLGYLDLLEVPADFTRVDPRMVRGLDYYTGPIFEIVVEEPRIGSISGGGRYDHLVGLLGPVEAPAVGISLGLERLIDVIDELGMAPAEVRSTVTEVLVTVFDQERLASSLAIAASLRAAGINTEVALETEKLGHQLRYAGRKNIPLAIIVGPDEEAAGVVIVRNMVTGQQERVERGALLGAIQEALDETAEAGLSAD
ncbi:MAG TPA: histidine--tRNA ligase [Chloroflexota bacterium]|nr:histidine--tRNA ligase [Chloroflexota bacterium]